MTLEEIRAIMEELDPIYSEEPGLEAVGSFIGFDSRRRVWLRIISNAVPIFTSMCEDEGFPDHFEEKSYDSPICAFDDCPRLDQIIQTTKRPAPRRAITSFVDSLQQAYELHRDVCLLPSLVFVHKGIIIFCRPLAKVEMKSSVFSWIYALITGDANFLYEEDANPLIAKWEGRLPRIMIEKKRAEVSRKDQVRLAKKWLQSFETNPQNAEASEARSMMQRLAPITGTWGIRATLSSVLLNPQDMTPSDVQKLVSWIPRWAPNLIEWSTKKRKLPSPNLAWFANLLQHVDSKTPTTSIAQCISVVSWTSYYIDGVGKEESAIFNDLYGLRNWKGQERMIGEWLENPLANLLKLPRSMRVTLLPLLAFIHPEEMDLNTFNGVLTSIAEANQMPPLGECYWDLVKVLIAKLDPVWHSEVPENTIEILEDILSITRSNPPDNDLFRIEAMGLLIALNEWTRTRDCLHATGETYKSLRRAFNKTLVGKDCPILDFAGISIEYERSISENSWRQLAEAWLRRYGNHYLRKSVEAILS
ncbi:MAG: hypothetical protein DRN81_02220 [Thermoproteota archaeon]|nr:MAG: hypothetical protein DRN81_02220 [Candidatus Korarchaeota archaeon]